MSRSRTALAALLGFAFLLPGVAARADSGALGQKVDAVLDRAIQENRIVGAVVLVARDGKIVYQRAAGLADKQRQAPMKLNSLFRLSSVSKPIVTWAALELVKRKTLSLDDPVTKWLPDFKPMLADGSIPTITIRQLLTHTAGLGYRFSEPAGGPYHKANISDGFDDVRIDLAEEVRRLGSVKLLNVPGSEWRYSLSVDVLGAVLERAAGKPLDALVAELVTRPLGMTGTSFRVAGAHPNQVATAYVVGSEGPVPMAEPQSLRLGSMTLVYSPARAFDPNAYPSAGAGMIGSAPDLLKLFEAMRKRGELFQNQIAGLPGMEPGMGFGLGGALVVDPPVAKTPQSAGTMYWGGVYGHSWFVDPAKKLSVVVLTNTAPTGMAGPFPDEVRDAVYAGS